MTSTIPNAIDTSVVVLNYNGLRWLKSCLPAAQASLGGAAELIVVDNGSTDGSVALLRQSFPAVKVVELERNLGFAGGNNAGARASQAPYLAFLNNDCVPQHGWIDALKAPFAEHTTVGLTTARIVYLHDPSVIDSAGDGYLRAGGAFKRFHGQPVADSGGSREVFGACGAAFMIRRDIFEELGGFDEDFFMVYEDVDLSYRARLRGHRCIYVAEAIVHHAGSGTLGRRSAAAVFLGQRNLEWTYLKNTPLSLLIRSFPSHLLYDAAGLISYAHAGLLRPYVRGKLAALMGLSGVLRKRSHLQHNRVAAATTLWNTMDAYWIRHKVREKQFDARVRSS